MRVWAFDVDETLEISNGPVKLQNLVDLRNTGDIVGICGNMGLFCQVQNWWHIVSFLGQGPLPKHIFLHNLKLNIPYAEDWIMVGNELGRVNGLGFVCGSNCKHEAALAGWRFLLEDEFAEGKR